MAQPFQSTLVGSHDSTWQCVRKATLQKEGVIFVLGRANGVQDLCLWILGSPCFDAQNSSPPPSPVASTTNPNLPLAPTLWELPLHFRVAPGKRVESVFLEKDN